MNSETAKNYVSHLLSSALSKLKLTAQLETLEISTPAAEFGDYSTNAALAMAKKLKVSPKQVAEKIIGEIKKIDEHNNFESIEEKGGFINFKLSRKFLSENMDQVLELGDLYGCSMVGAGQKILVEYFQPNVAKPLHLGHLRTAIIGDSLFRILSSQGYKAESDTHLGDWGTQFGILIWAYKQSEGKKLFDSYPNDPIAGLNRLYVDANTVWDKEAVLEGGKAEFLKLEQGDKENRKLWQQFRDWSWQEYNVVYKELGIRKSDHDWPESFFEDKMPKVFEELKEKGLLKESQGAQIVDLESYKLGVAVVVKSDGATTYLFRDLATYIYRKSQGFEKQLYVVDVRQQHTLAQTFKILQLLGYIQNPEEAVHISYGFLTLPEGAMSTRKGKVISANEFIGNVQKLALEVINRKNPELKNKEDVAKHVAAGAIKYFDLAHNIKSDIVFDPQKAISFEGNTGPYLQYTHARIQGILRRAQGTGERVQLLTPQPSTLNPHESAILRKLVKFPEIVEQVSKDYLPNALCNYLFELSQMFNSFYQAVPILQEKDDSLRSFRLQLITATAQAIRNGLYLLGIEAPEEM